MLNVGRFCVPNINLILLDVCVACVFCFYLLLLPIAPDIYYLYFPCVILLIEVSVIIYSTCYAYALQSLSNEKTQLTTE